MINKFEKKTRSTNNNNNNNNNDNNNNNSNNINNNTDKKHTITFPWIPKNRTKNQKRNTKVWI